MSHLNMAQILELKELMEDSFSDLIQTYIQDSDIKLNALKVAVNSTDSHEAAELAHSLKGSSANICAESLSALFQTVENAGRAQDLHHIPQVIEQIEQEFLLVKTQLQQL
ncbi:MAG: HPt (histidine-containing phosphotransfer) domain-containing protein [Oceanicoccus sp.]|jgi:HPt (histidine-containing phosphotransfer) domain-containing protein